MERVIILASKRPCTPLRSRHRRNGCPDKMTSFDRHVFSYNLWLIFIVCIDYHSSGASRETGPEFNRKNRCKHWRKKQVQNQLGNPLENRAQDLQPNRYLNSHLTNDQLSSSSQPFALSLVILTIILTYVSYKIYRHHNLINWEISTTSKNCQNRERRWSRSTTIYKPRLVNSCMQNVPRSRIFSA